MQIEQKMRLSKELKKKKIEEVICRQGKCWEAMEVVKGEEREGKVCGKVKTTRWRYLMRW